MESSSGLRRELELLADETGVYLHLYSGQEAVGVGAIANLRLGRIAEAGTDDAMPGPHSGPR